jgi:hypothetical protein
VADGPYLIQFVDSVSATATVRLDLGSSIWVVQPDADLSPPELRYATTSTLMVDGEGIPAAAYANRLIKLTLQLRGGASVSADTAAGYVQTLARELNRPNNILKWQPGNSFPVFFRTFRGGLDSLYWDPLQKMASLAIPAEPFAIGLEETASGSPFTVSNDPAAASNGCFWDVTGVKGDVETPIMLRRPTTNAGEQSLFAVRRRGTPSSAPFLLQAEGLTQQTDTSTQPNSATFSGAGNNFSRVSFATATALTLRLSVSKTPGSPSVNSRGTYRVFMRCRKNGSSSTIAVRMSYATPSVASTHVFNDQVTISGTTVQMVDVGTVSLPIGQDPVTRGYSNVEYPTEGIWFGLEASRTGGTDTLDVDYFLWVPADDRFAIVAWTPDGSVGSSDRLCIDGPMDTIHGQLNSSGELTSLGNAYFVGGLPMLSPNQTNRIYHVNEVGLGLAEPSFPTTWSIEVSYFPRYMLVAPS